MKTLKKSIEKETFIVVGIFLLSVILRYMIGNYPKMFHVYFDELIYYDEAESIATGRGLLVHNTYFGLARILYPLIISPAFLIADRAWQWRIVLLINTLVMSSAVFPVYLLAKRFLGKKERLIIVCISIIMSDLAYTMTLMSEVLFLPLTLWLIYFFTSERKCIKNKYHIDVRKAVVTGLLSALVYYTKEVGLMFLPAFFMVYIYDVIASEKKDRKDVFVKSVAEFLIISVTFCVLILPHFFELFDRIMSLVTRNPVEMEGTMLTDTSVLGSIITLFNAALMQMIYCVLAIGIVPAVIIALKWKEMNLLTRRFCVLLLFLMVFTSCLVASTITIIEDDIFPFPRAHLRYVCYLWMPALIIFYSLYKEEIKFDKIKWIISMCIIIAIAFIFKGAYEFTTIDQTMLYYENKVFNDHVWIYRIAICLVAIFVYPLYCKNKKLIFKIFVIVYSLVLISNNIIAVLIHRKDYRVEKDEWERISAMEEYVREKKECTFLVIDDTFDDPQRLMDTFLNIHNVYFVKTDDVITEEKESRLRIGEHRLHSGFFREEKDRYNIDHVDYIVVRNDKGVYVEDSGIRMVGNIGLKEYDVYELNDNTVLPYIYNKDHQEGIQK